jgi:uncharacterized protein YozE (UPF0346 family)
LIILYKILKPNKHTLIKISDTMHFYQFITTQLGKGPDIFIEQVIDLIKKDSTFPKETSDPAQIAIHLYLKLNEPQTNAYQKLLMLYKHMAPNNKMPNRSTAREDMFLQAVNIIIILQNNDSRYKYHTV